MRTIAHRSVLILLAGLFLAPPARAAEVARNGGASLDARDSRFAGFCLRVTLPRDRGSSGTCGRAPWRERRSAFVTAVGGDRVVVGGAAPAAVARVEAELANGRRVAFDTVRGPRYRGRHAGRLRFFLAVLPLTDPGDDDAGGVVALRLLDAGGALRGVAAERDGRVVGQARALLRERGRGASITVTGVVLRRLAPTPLELDRFEDHTCIVVRSRSATAGGETRVCREPGPSRPVLSVFPEAGCGTVRTVLTGFVGDAVSAVRVRLGSGRVLEVPSRTLRGGNGTEHRYVAAVVPRGEAIRGVAAVGTPARYRLGEAPSGLPCIHRDGAFVEAYAFADLGWEGPARPLDTGEQLAVEAGGHRLLVRDEVADRLCAGVDRLLADGSDCVPPPPTADSAFGFARSGFVSAVLPVEVARVRLPGGREVPTVGGGYTGRYAGAVRFLLVEAEVGPGERIRMLDAAGATIGTLFVATAEEPAPSRRARPLAAGRGWRLTAEREEGFACLGLSLRRQPASCSAALAGDDGAFAAVGCVPRVAVLFGTLARRTRSVRVVLRDGRTLHPRILRVPRRLGRGRAFVLALPRRAEVTALRLDGRRFPLPLLPAARQCGYRLHAPFLSPPVRIRR